MKSVCVYCSESLDTFALIFNYSMLGTLTVPSRSPGAHHTILVNSCLDQN